MTALPGCRLQAASSLRRALGCVGAGARAMLLVVAAWLGGCAAPPSPPVARDERVAIDPTVERAAVDEDPELDRFERVLRERAGQAAKAGRLADAAMAWEVLTALRPGDPVYQRQLAVAREAIRSAVARLTERALSEQRRGDAAAAAATWLELLSADPLHAAAAQALREIERERHRGSGSARFVAPGGRPAWPAASETGTPRPSQRTRFEHASLLAAQGELDAAIDQLTEPSGANAADARTRALLVELLLRRAEQTADRSRIAAIADLELALRLDPGSARARARLQQLRRSP